MATEMKSPDSMVLYGWWCPIGEKWNCPYSVCKSTHVELYREGVK